MLGIIVDDSNASTIEINEQFSEQDGQAQSIIGEGSIDAQPSVREGAKQTLGNLQPGRFNI